jgi:ABC-type antimicrobial peptide transport system permease subunit
MRILRRFLARVKNFAMGQRSREFGIRVAVGATRGNVMAVVFHQGLVLTLIGASVGVGAALPAARALTQLLFGISPLDATSFCSSVVLLGFDVSRRMCHPGTCGQCALTLFVR